MAAEFLAKKKEMATGKASSDLFGMLPGGRLTKETSLTEIEAASAT